LALLAFTPLNLAFDRFTQHMRASLKFLQHVIDASDCPDLSGKKMLSEYLDVDAIWCSLDLLGPTEARHAGKA
jgi:hypothetical protein